MHCYTIFIGEKPGHDLITREIEVGVTSRQRIAIILGGESPKKITEYVPLYSGHEQRLVTRIPIQTGSTHAERRVITRADVQAQQDNSGKFILYEERFHAGDVVLVLCCILSRSKDGSAWANEDGGITILGRNPGKVKDRRALYVLATMPAGSTIHWTRTGKTHVKPYRDVRERGTIQYQGEQLFKIARSDENKEHSLHV